ncbi:MAG: trigger factor [Prevotella sp.]
MNISFDNSAKVSGKLTIVVEEADYNQDYEKALKSYRKNANVPGFRKGMAPMSMIKRQIGPQVLVDTLNKLVGNKLYEYIREEKIDMLGEPMPAAEQEQIDIEKPAPYTFIFDIALAPELNVTIGADDTIPFYNINVDDKIIDEQVNMYASRSGSYEKVDEYQDNDMLKGDLRQLDIEGNTLEGGISISESIVMPKYIKDEDEKKKFENVKMGDIITFNPRKAYASDAELASFLKVDKEQVFMYTGDFSYQVTEISRYKPHAVDAELFEQAYPGEEIADEAAFRARITTDIKAQFAMNSDFRFLHDVRKAAEEKAGEVKYADELMKKIMLANNTDKGQEYVDQHYDASIKELTWSLLKNKLSEAAGVKVEDKDVKAAAKEMAKMQFAQYGMSNVPDEYLEKYAEDMLKKQETLNNLVERAVDTKLTAALKATVKLDEKNVSLNEFNKLFEN